MSMFQFFVDLQVEELEKEDVVEADAAGDEERKEEEEEKKEGEEAGKFINMNFHYNWDL